MKKAKLFTIHQSGLMPGNYLYYRDSQACSPTFENKIDAEDIKLIYEKQSYADMHRPIKLSIAWLKKLGFVNELKRDKVANVNGQWWKDGLCIYEYFWDGGFMYASYVKNNGDLKAAFNIDSVHRLQNLYQTLCLKPLTLLPEFKTNKPVDNHGK
jgi:hypothetical protein